MDATAHFAAQLAFYTDVADVAAVLPDAGFVLLDSRSAAGWEQGHIPGAVHMPTREIASRALAELDPATPIVTYCWGPGCNGATRAALELTRLGYRVKEMIGGIEYWIREGLPVRTAEGDVRAPVDPRTAPVSGACVC
jgi:rhodanese-related sulfurtransferase